jgi:hypothetical protein
MKLRMGVSRIVGVGIAGGVVALSFACNTVLDNQPGELAGADAAVDAGSAVVVSNDAGPQIDSSLPVASQPDATLPPPDADAGAPSTPPPVDSGTLPVCAFGQKLCDGSCVSVDDPLFGCGPTACTPCALDRASATCAGSGCAIASCNAGYADCDQSATNGCETDLSQSTHCGTCNSQCGSAAPDCTPSAGGFTCATGCSAGAPTLCGTQCVELQTSLDNCGACGTACPAAPNGQTSCTAGHCGFSCQADFHACGSACVSDLSPSTCGTSCAPCPTGANAVPTCNGAACGMECAANFANCNAATADGCEVDLLTDPANCGVCNHSCAGQACNAGVCAVAPPPPPPDAGTPPVDSGSPRPPVDSGADVGSSVAPPDAGDAMDGASE